MLPVDTDPAMSFVRKISQQRLLGLTKHGLESKAPARQEGQDLNVTTDVELFFY